MAREIPGEIRAYYAHGLERARLSDAEGSLEFERVQAIVRGSLPPPPARILDVGGGPGTHAAWLAAEGYEVAVVDPIPLHVEQALALAGERSGSPFTAETGDARQLRAADSSLDAVLLLGPLYHLTERADRILALREAVRVARPGGVVIAAAISRFASWLDGTRRGWLASEPEFKSIALRDLATGRHKGKAGDDPRWFTTAYFHLPGELGEELADAGLADIQLVAVQGPFWLLGDLEARLADPVQHRALIESIEAICREPSLMGASSHILAVGRRPLARPT